MTDWKNIFIPLITVVLSSSIIGTILNSTYQDFAESITKPVFDFGGSSTHDVTTGIIDLSIRITNNGNEDAQNPIITIKLVDKVKLIGIPKVESYLHGNIIVDANDTSTFSYNLENDTINQGEMIEIQAKLKESEVSSFYYYSSGLDYISNIKVRYDNGFASLSDSQYRNEEFISYTLFTILPFIILGLSISIPFVYLKKLSRLGNNKNYEFKINIANLLLKMYDSIRNNTSSKKIFDFKFWNEEYSETKRKIFDSYTDYNILNKLDTLLKDRELICLKDNIDDAVLTESNINCLKLTTEALNHINWKTFLFDSISKKHIELNYLHHCLFALIIVGIDIGLTFFLFFLFTNSSSIFYDWLPYGLAIEIVQLIGVGSIVGVIGTIRTLLFYKLSSYSLFKDLSCFKKFKSNSKNKKLDSLIIITIAFSSALIIIYLSIPLGIGVIYFIYANFLSYFCWVLLIEIIRFNIAVYLVTKKIGSMKIQPMIGF